MNTNGKWIARAGGLLLLLGFFLPSVAVSCSALTVKQSFSLSDLAGQNGGGGLFLVLIAALVIMGLTFIPARTRSTASLLIIGQLISMGISALIVLITLAYMYSQVKKASNLGGLLQGYGSSLFTYSLEFGAFILLLGYILAGVGAFLQVGEGGLGRNLFRTAGWAIPGISSPIPPAPVPQQAGFSEARLEVVSGTAPRSTIPVADNFIVGRSQECQLQLPDPGVSRQHLRLRYASGAWFLQDMGSAGGTLVNGQPVQAIRLNSGDQIKIGSITMIFRM
jgi:hypothetical protein